jgi:hypothetical protein
VGSGALMADPVIKKSGVYQKFNLKEMFGVDVSRSPELKKAIGQAIIEHIVKRTEDGMGRDGKALKSPYSDSYSESLPFKAAGKSKRNVNMTLNGDMMGLLDIIDESANTITIGWEDETEILKAYNHNVGDTLPRRPFFGLKSSRSSKTMFNRTSRRPDQARRPTKTHDLISRNVLWSFSIDSNPKMMGSSDGEKTRLRP